LGLLLDFRAAHASPPGSSQQPVCLQVKAAAVVIKAVHGASF
jgi:hypothetical protein